MAKTEAELAEERRQYVRTRLAELRNQPAPFGITETERHERATERESLLRELHGDAVRSADANGYTQYDLRRLGVLPIPRKPEPPEAA